MRPLLSHALFDPRWSTHAYGAVQASEASRSMPVDIFETENTFEIHAEVPGVSKEDISVEINDGIVTLSAKVKVAESTTPEADGVAIAAAPTALRLERSFGTKSGSFERRFKLGVDVDAEAAVARLDRGVLVLTLPKKISATRRVTIQ